MLQRETFIGERDSYEQSGHRQLKKLATSDTDTQQHGIINYIDTAAKCRHLKKLTYKGTLQQVFNQSLWTGDTVSHVGIFNPAL
jgi:hypothetical protein